MTCSLHRLLQLGGQDSTRVELVTRINKILKPRLGQRRMRIEYNGTDGLLVFCGSRDAVPVMFMHAAKRVYEVDSEGTLLRVLKSM